MKKITAVVLILALAVCLVSATDTTATPTTLLEQFSYVLGYEMALGYGSSAMNAFYYYQYYAYPEADDYFGYLGAYDGIMGNCLYTDEQIQTIIEDYTNDYSQRMVALAAENLRTAEDFLSGNGSKEGVQTTSSGLQYKVITQGTGARPASSDTVELDYELTLLDGTVVDSSYARGEHSSFPMDGVIKGFAEGVMLMPLGSHYIFYIHPDLGYGDSVMPTMGPNSLLVFEVETYSIVQ